jgi:AcrR family transcriptional regulator
MAKKVDHQERRGDIAKAAFWGIAKHGFQSVTLAKVARETGRSVGALMHYINSKDELLLMASEYAIFLLSNYLREIEERYVGLEALRQTVYIMLPLDAEKAGLFTLWFGFCARARENEKIATMVNLRYKGFQQNYTTLIKEAQKRGETPANVNPTTTAKNLVALIDGISMQNLVGNGISPRVQRQQVDSWIERTLSLRSSST